MRRLRSKEESSLLQPELRVDAELAGIECCWLLLVVVAAAGSRLYSGACCFLAGSFAVDLTYISSYFTKRHCMDYFASAISFSIACSFWRLVSDQVSTPWSPRPPEHSPCSLSFWLSSFLACR